MPLVTVPATDADAVRVRCELHTPWTQLLDLSGSRGSGAAQDQASAYQSTGSDSGIAAQPATAVAEPSSAAAGAAAASAESLSCNGSADTADNSQPAPAGGSGGTQQRQQHDRQQHQQHANGEVLINDPQRQKLLIIASLGVEGGSGWLSHVAAHFAGLRDSQTGQPAADVVTFDNRRRWSSQPGQQPPKEGASGYSSEVMARDAVAVMDALGWKQAHLVGMSLGAMVAAKAAAAAPRRIASLTLLGYTLNGWQMAASLVTAPHRLLPVILGSERSRVRATLPFYFTRRFLDTPLSQRQQEALAAAAAGTPGFEQAAGGRGSAGAATADIETGGRMQHGSSISTCSSDGGDVSVNGRQLQRALLGHRQRQGAEDPAAVTRQDAILGNQALASAAARRDGSDATAQRAGSAAPNSGDLSGRRRQPDQKQLAPEARSFAQAADAALGEAGPAGLAAWGAEAFAAAEVKDETALPDTGLRSHSLACLLHWLTKAQARTIADGAFPTTLLVGRHDPVAPVKWVQHAASRLRGTLVVTEASHAGLTVESCPEVLSTLELNVFDRTLGDRGAWTAVQDAAVDDAVTNPHLIKR